MYKDLLKMLSMKCKDPYSGEFFEQKRSNQRFANRANQIKFNNEKARELRRKSSEIMKQLQRNLNILNEVVGQRREVSFHQQFLLGKGFSLSVHTHIEEWQGENRFAIYQYILVVIGNEQIKIIRK